MGKVIARDVSLSMGFDVDGANIAVCVGTREDVVYEGRIAYCLEAVDRMRAPRGIGVVTAVTFRVEVFRAEEFGRAESVSCYLGLTPSERSSGGHRRLGHIHRMGNAHLRRVLVQAAWSMVRWDTRARRHFQRLLKPLGKKKAIVAVARRVGIGLWASMVRGEAFENRWS